MMRAIIVMVVFLTSVMLTSCTRTDSHAAKNGRDSVQASTTSVEKEYYTCPMHPSVISDKPGACPVCGMALVKKSAQKKSSDADLALVRGVSLSQSQRVIANVSTIQVRKGSMQKEVNAVGVVDYAEPLQAKVAARFRGRIEQLYVDFTGAVVHKGQPLFELYSPDLVSAEQELILAANALEHSTNTDAEGQQRLLQATRDRLRTHFGLTSPQIKEIEESRQVRTTATFNSPIHGTVISKEVQQGQYVDEGMLLYQLADLSKVWIYLDVYERDVRFVKLGREVKITTESYPDDSFSGRVTFVDPVLSGETRTVRVRTEFNNPDGMLKPQMYVKAQLVIPVKDALIVPASAVLSTGRHDVVWVEVDSNKFEPRDVTLGVHAELACEVLSGLNEGELIVVSGGFMLESESQLQHPPKASEPQVSATESIHDHNATLVNNHSGEAANTIQAKAEEVRILVNGQFMPDVVHVKKGQRLTLKFFPQSEVGCVNEVVFEQLRIRRSLLPGRATTVTLTPKKAGEITFACGMGMVKGKVVVEN